MMPLHATQRFPILSLMNVKHIIAVASGKGGVGKTTVAVNLSLALTQTGARVGLFDADLYGPNVPLMLGVQRRTPSHGQIPTYRDKPAPYIDPLERFGLKVMSIGFVVASDETLMPDPKTQGDIIRQTLQDVKWGELDYLVIDFPPGTGEPQQTLLRTIRISGVVLVTMPQDLSLMDASRSLGLFREEGVPVLGVVENMSYLICPHCGEPIEVFYRSGLKWAIEDKSVELLGRIPIDIEISRPIDRQHPFDINDGSRKVFAGIARRVTEKLKNPPGKIKFSFGG